MPARAAPAIVIDAAKQSPLGMPPTQFLRDYWQRHPLLIRDALPGFTSPIEPEDLAGLACEDGVLARLIEHDAACDGWRVRHGPFAEDVFPGLPDHGWVLQVQDVDKWDADIRALLDQFTFLPRWRIDDIAVSFAANGGSAGARTSPCGMFLLQAAGRCRWQIDTAPQSSAELRDGVGLPLLRNFQPTHGWLLEPGDLLYLPPGMPHCDLTDAHSLTFAVTLCAPSAAELLDDHADTLAASAPDNLRYTDPGLALPEDACEIDDAALQRVDAVLQQLRMDDPDQFGDWFGSFITSYRSGLLPVAGETTPSHAAVERALAAGMHVLRHPWSRMAWRRTRRDPGSARLYAGGTAHSLTVTDARRLAAADRINGTLYAALEQAGRNAVITLLAAGHYHLDTEPGT